MYAQLTHKTKMCIQEKQVKQMKVNKQLIGNMHYAYVLFCQLNFSHPLFSQKEQLQTASLSCLIITQHIR